MFGFFSMAAADLEVGESTTVSNDVGDSYTVTKHADHNSVVGNNQQSRDKLNRATSDDDETDD